ncbi:MBL fold metallo-hydrolase [candidate division KSB1 bacterium]|nr:MBL fold metallo-hydrolase [candidate division KSB1 bacterium]RQW02708.1 MAG: MBL fold metallo-hydrolase [candidate division KSB1 bacterium]
MSNKALPKSHTPHTNGYRIEYDGRVLTFSGDTGPCEEIEQLAKNADLALFECSFPDGEQLDFHLTPRQAGEIAQKAGVKKLVLTHFYPMMDNLHVKSACANVFSGDIDLAEDFKIYHV